MAPRSKPEIGGDGTLKSRALDGGADQELPRRPRRHVNLPVNAVRDHRRHVGEGDHLTSARLDTKRRAERGHELAAPGARGQEDGITLDALALGDEASDLAGLDHEARDVAARLELDACGGRGLRVRENQALIVQPVVALDEDRVADVRSEGRLEPVDVVAFQKLDAEFLEIPPRRDVTPLLGRRRRIDGPARDVLDVDPGALLEVTDDVGVQAPARDGEAREARFGRLVDGRKQAGRGARGLRAGRGPLE